MIETICREAKQLNKNHPNRTRILWGVMATSLIFFIAGIQLVMAGQTGQALIGFGLAGAMLWGPPTEALRLFHVDQETERARLIEASEEFDRGNL